MLVIFGVPTDKEDSIKGSSTWKGVLSTAVTIMEIVLALSPSNIVYIGTSF